MGQTTDEISTTVPDHEFVSDARTAAIKLEDDPHKAALEENPEDVHVSFSAWASIGFISLSFGPPIGLAFLCLASIVTNVAQALHGSDATTWIVGAWSLASAVSFSLAGPLSDIFGRRLPILFGQAVVIVGAIVGATAKDIGAVIAAQTLIGFGTGFLFVSYAGVPEMLPNKWRALGLGLLEVGISIPWGLVAALMGNAIYQGLGWRWIFYFAIIQESVSLVGTAVYYWPASRPRGDFDKTRWQQIKEIDFIGLFLFTGGLTTFLTGVTWGGTTAHPWKSAGTITPIILGVVACCTVFFWEAFAKVPMFPFSLMAQFRQFSILLLVMFVSGMNFYSMSSLLPQGSLYIFSPDPVQIGIISMPNNIFTLVTGVLLPVLAHRIKYIKYQLIAALTVQLVFIAATAGALEPNHKASWMILPAIGVPMFAWVTILAYSIAGLHVPHSHLGVATGLLGTFRAAGGAVGNAIFNTIFTNRFDAFVGSEVVGTAVQSDLSPEIAPKLIPAVIEYNIGVPGNGLLQIPGVTPQVASVLQTAVRHAYARSFKIVFYCTIPFGVLALVCAFFVEDSSQYMTNHVQQAMKRTSSETRQNGDVPKEEGAVYHVE